MDLPNKLVCAILGEQLSVRKRDWARRRFSHLIATLAARYDTIIFCTASIGGLQQAFYAALEDARTDYPQKQLSFWYYGADHWVGLIGFQPVYRVGFDHMRTFPYYNRKLSLQISAAVREMLSDSGAAICYAEGWRLWRGSRLEIRYAKRCARQLTLDVYDLKQVKPGRVQKKFTHACKR